MKHCQSYFALLEVFCFLFFLRKLGNASGYAASHTREIDKTTPFLCVMAQWAWNVSCLSTLKPRRWHQTKGLGYMSKEWCNIFSMFVLCSTDRLSKYWAYTYVPNPLYMIIQPIWVSFLCLIKTSYFVLFAIPIILFLCTIVAYYMCVRLSKLFFSMHDFCGLYKVKV